MALAIYCAGCGSAVFIVKSDPIAADVFVQDAKTGEKKLLGKTPLSMPPADVKKQAGEVNSGEFFTIIVEKAGFASQTFNVPAHHAGTMITALDVKFKEGQSLKEMRTAQDILDHMILAQKLATTQQLERAQIEIDKVLQTYPNFARALSMRGAIYYAQKNYPESMKSYEAALKNDPQMDDAVKMLGKVRSLQGLPPGPVPASALPAAVPASAPAPGK